MDRRGNPAGYLFGDDQPVGFDSEFTDRREGDGMGLVAAATVSAVLCADISFSVFARGVAANFVEHFFGALRRGDDLDSGAVGGFAAA